MRFQKTAFPVLAVLLFGHTSCSLFQSKEDEDITPYDPKTAPTFSELASEHLRYSVDGGAANTVQEEVTGLTLEQVKKDAEARGLRVTNPDNIEESIASLESVFKIKYGTDWERTYEKAREESLRSQRPLIIWFSDSRRSPNSIQMSKELLDTQDFSDWAKDKVIRLKLDQNITGYDSRGETKRKDYLKKLSKIFNVNGTPQLIIQTPDGQIVDHIRGYVSGSQDSIFRKIKNSSDIATNRFKETKKKLIQAGFRDWTGQNKVKLFARLYKCDPSGKVILQEPDGRFLKSSLNNMSIVDQAWIETQRIKREESKNK